MKKIVSIVITVSLLLMVISVVTNADNHSNEITVETMSNGVLPEQNFDFIDNELFSSGLSLDTRSVDTLPTSVDLSTSIYAPPIKNQGSSGACVAFAVAYYQFTYEKNRLLGITTSSTDSSTWYTPL